MGVLPGVAMTATSCGATRVAMLTLGSYVVRARSSIARCRGVTFGALDGESVHVFFLLLSP